MKMIIGTHSNSPTECYNWYLPQNLEWCANVDSYAVVQNCNEYALVKIVGIVETEPKHQKLLTGIEHNKRVIKIINEKTIQDWRESSRTPKKSDIITQEQEV